MNKEILIVPFHGTVEASKDTNIVTVSFCSFNRNKKLKGYTLIGAGWRMETDPAIVADDNGWKWHVVIGGRINTEFVSEEEACLLCYFLRKTEVIYLVLMDDGSGRYRVMCCSDAKFYFNSSLCPTIAFTGVAPYPVTYFDGEVEIAGRAVDLADQCIGYGLRQTQGWECE